MPVAGSIAIRAPEKPRVSNALPGPWTRPPPTSGGKEEPIGRNVPLCKSTTPNCGLPVITYTRLWLADAGVWTRRAASLAGTSGRPYDWAVTAGLALDEAG